MNRNVFCLCLIFYAHFLTQCQTARILVFIPTASYSHQAVSNVLSQELVRRGHEVVMITTNPMFSKGKSPSNLTEVDIREVGYAAKDLSFAKTVHGRNDDVLSQVIKFFDHVFTDIFEAEIKSHQVQAIINNKNQKFDLLILEACTRVELILTHIFKAPAILVSSFGNIGLYTDYTGAASHPLLFPIVLHQKLYNLTFYDKMYELYKHYVFENSVTSFEQKENAVLRKHFGPHVPSIGELKKNIAMVFVSEHQVWDNNRPVPPNLVYIGGIYPERSNYSLPQDIDNFLNASVNGVVYVSFGTTVFPSMLPQEIIRAIVNTLTRLPYDVLLKWDKVDLPGLSKNVKLFHWAPQSQVLRHPKIKLFITQGGLQSTDDAIAAGVPLVGLPMLGDQWYNVEQYLRFKIGVKVDVESITEEKMLKAVHTVINDESYRRNIVALRESLNDQPQTALERAVWWSEYVIRHQGAPLLRAPTALISSWEYYEGDLLLTLATCVITAVVMLMLLFYSVILFYRRTFKHIKID